ncbi:MAG: sensor domain-containing diguanylate cyclase [Clostridia bacterium]|nr:sensor domain-containing diguanylate cyclase [Clostridia bacterium]
MRQRKWKKALFAIILLLNVVFFLNICRYDYKTIFNNQTEYYKNHFNIIVNEFKAKLDMSMSFIYGLEGFTYASLNYDLTQEQFEVFATRAQYHDNFIKNFSVAPDAVQLYVFPLEGNEVTLNHNLKTDARENVVRDVLTAMETGEMVISGPYELRQGGLGMVVRSPIYKDSLPWGLVNVVVDVQSMIEESNLYNCKELSLELQHKGEAFWGSVQEPNYEIVLSVGNETWIVKTHLPDQLTKENHLSFVKNAILLGVSITISITFLIYIIENNTTLSKKINYMIYHDSLTNLPNRRALSEKIDLWIREKKEFTLGFLDLDNFKEINDKLGHALGDELLKVIAERLTSHKSAEVYRFGGDEFILISELKIEAFEKLIVEIQSHLSNAVHLNEVIYHITSSVGICAYPHDAATKDELIQLADKTMYYVKSIGKNSYQIHQS